LAGTTLEEEGAGNTCMLWTGPVSVGGVVFLMAFRARRRLLAFRVASPLMRLLVFSAACSPSAVVKGCSPSSSGRVAVNAPARL
jgi:hypothetical protein